VGKKIDLGDGFYSRDGELFDEITGYGYKLSDGHCIQVDMSKPLDQDTRLAACDAAALRAGYDWPAMRAERVERILREAAA
jgi:hypothetical protein